MKKTKCCLAILISLSLMLIGCSNESGISNEPSVPRNLDTLKELSVVYGIEEDRIIINEDFDVAVNKFFSDSSNDGLFAEIVPLGYTFYYTVSKDDYTGEFYLDGYAECRCSIKKKSQKYNISKHSGEEIYIRQEVFLDPLNEDAMLRILKDVGACKDDETYIAGTYKVPEKLINKTDYRLLMKEPVLMLLEDKSYYSFITFYKDIAYLGVTIDRSIVDSENVPDDVKESCKNFYKFLTENDPELLE